MAAAPNTHNAAAVQGVQWGDTPWNMSVRGASPPRGGQDTWNGGSIHYGPGQELRGDVDSASCSDGDNLDVVDGGRLASQ
mmetsp:Transcript_19780/g.43045  ORF Transcript_19780/g.43045 Transcript_19780/m.43045 type:complete len:80 (-) Transcript_19780:2307-2546(-)